MEQFNEHFMNVTEGLKLLQGDKFQSSENEESCSLMKEHYGEENVSFNLISKDDLIKAVRKLP